MGKLRFTVRTLLWSLTLLATFLGGLLFSRKDFEIQIKVVKPYEYYDPNPPSPSLQVPKVPSVPGMNAVPPICNDDAPPSA